MDRPEKSAAELRRMILDAVSGHAVCPQEMDLRIVTGGEHRWDVECIPPTSQHIAYAQCCDLMTKEAAKLRAQFDLKSN